MDPAEIKTWATLREGTPFAPLFPDGKVPIVSLISVKPDDEVAPLCYEVDVNLLSAEQVDGLAELLWLQWQPECSSKNEAAAYIREGLPIGCGWFIGVTTVDQKMMAMLMGVADEQLAEFESEESEYWEGDRNV